MTAATRLNPGLTRFSVQLLLRPPSQDEEFIPEPLRDHPYRVDSEESYQELYGFLTGQAGVPLPEAVACFLWFSSNYSLVRSQASKARRSEASV